jgi:hypothetical protein
MSQDMTRRVNKFEIFQNFGFGERNMHFFQRTFSIGIQIVYNMISTSISDITGAYILSGSFTHPFSRSDFALSRWISANKNIHLINRLALCEIGLTCKQALTSLKTFF